MALLTSFSSLSQKFGANLMFHGPAAGPPDAAQKGDPIRNGGGQVLQVIMMQI